MNAKTNNMLQRNKRFFYITITDLDPMCMEIANNTSYKPFF